MITTSSIRGRIGLSVAHCAGMLDLVALPVWVGTLIQYYKLDPQQAGGLATIFLFSAVVASIVIARRFRSGSGRWVAVIGFALAAISFAAVTQTGEFALMALLHSAAGLSAGAALSVTHGTIAQSENPHRLFAVVGAALGVFGVVFYAAVPNLIAANGGPALFVVFAFLMFVGAVVSMFAFPVAESGADQGSNNSNQTAADTVAKAKIPTVVWFGIVGISAMGLIQAMTFSFLERAGDASGFGMEAITGVLIALGIVNLFPAPLAGFLQHRISARWVMLLAPGIQALLTYIIMTAESLSVYAVSASIFVGVIIFTHIFVFGVLARLDISGRALAATPAMTMIGAGIGPILGGSLVKGFGYESLGLAAICIAILATFCFSRVHSNNDTRRV